MVAVDERDPAVVERVVAREEEVAGDRRRVATPLPLAPLHDDRHRRRQQREPSRVIEMQVRQHDPRQRVEVDLVGDVLRPARARMIAAAAP